MYVLHVRGYVKAGASKGRRVGRVGLAINRDKRILLNLMDSFRCNFWIQTMNQIKLESNKCIPYDSQSTILCATLISHIGF